jgi:hypothetical protein
MPPFVARAAAALALGSRTAAFALAMQALSWPALPGALRTTMYLVAIAWLYVVVLMALAEGLGGGGSWLGAAITLVFYGLLPLAIALYLIGTPSRRAARRRATMASGRGGDPDGGGHPAGDAVAPERKEA